MKKFFTILVVALVAMTCVFASFDASKLSVGVGAGISDDIAVATGRGVYLHGHDGHYGFDLSVRADYDLKENVTLTAVFDWSILNREAVYGRVNFFALNTNAVTSKTEATHKLALMLGGTNTIKLSDKVLVDVTVGPEFKVCCNDGVIDLGVKGIAKGSYVLNDKFDLNLSLAGSYYFLVDGTWFDTGNDEVRINNFNVTATAGITYKF